MQCIPKELTIFSSGKIKVDDRIFLTLSVRLRRRFFRYSFWYEAMNFILTVSFPEWLYSYQGIYLPSSSQNHNSIELSLKLCCLGWHLDDFCIFCPIVILKLSPGKPVEDLLTFGFSNPPCRRTHSKSPFFSGNFKHFKYSKYFQNMKGRWDELTEWKKASNFWLISFLWKKFETFDGGTTILNSLWCKRNWKLETSHNFPERGKLSSSGKKK